MRNLPTPVPMPVKRADPPHVQLGLCAVWWSAAATEEMRTKVLAEMQAIKPRRRYRVSHVVARARAEAHGVACLTESPPEPLTESTLARAEMVRISYLTMGDEHVHFEFGPMHPVTAANIVSSYCYGPRVVPGVRATSYPVKRPRDLQAHLPWPPVAEFSRLVVLPSQRTEAVDRSEGEAEAIAA